MGEPVPLLNIKRCGGVAAAVKKCRGASKARADEVVLVKRMIS